MVLKTAWIIETKGVKKAMKDCADNNLVVEIVSSRGPKLEMVDPNGTGTSSGASVPLTMDQILASLQD